MTRDNSDRIRETLEMYFWPNKPTEEDTANFILALQEQEQNDKKEFYGEDPEPLWENHSRCFHCGAYDDECQCSGGY